MVHRKRLIQATTVLLYMGPLLAGLAGFGFAYLPPFVALFMLWLVMLRPHKWPQRPGDWLTPTAGLAALTLISSQIVFVALLFGIGRGLGGVLGLVPLFNPLLPLALSLVAIPLLRMAWVPEEALASGETIDQLLWSDAAAAAPRPVPASAEAAVAGLFALSAEGPSETGIMFDRLDQFLDAGDIWSRLAVLSAAFDALPVTEHLGLRTAVILKASDPVLQSDYTVPGEMRAAFAAAGSSAELLSLLGLRARALLQKIPAAAAYFPPASVIQDIADGCEDSSAARALRDLVAALVAAGRTEPAAGPASDPSSSDPASSDPARARPTAARPAGLGFVPPVAGAQGA